MSQYNQGYPFGGYQNEQQYWNDPNQAKSLPQGYGNLNRENEIQPQGFQNQRAQYIPPRANQLYQDPNLVMPNLYQEPQKYAPRLQESLISLLDGMANLVAAYSPPEGKEQLRNLINQTVQDYPELKPNLEMLLQNQPKIFQPQRAEIPNRGCQHYGAEKYMTVCKQSHCKECLRELIFASPDINQKVDCPCGVTISRKNRDELAPELNPNLKKKLTNHINAPPPQADLRQNFNIEPQNFQQNRKSAENPEIYNQYAEKLNQPQFPRAQNPPSLSKNQFPAQYNPQFIPKQLPQNDPSPPPQYQSPPQLPKNPRSGPRIDPNKKGCNLCYASKDLDEFTAIACAGHDICSACRVEHFYNSHECPICFRGYSDIETDIISVLAATLPPGEIKPPQQNMQNIPRKEEISYICVHCGNKIPQKETYTYECQHPLHNQCWAKTGCPICG